MVSVRFWKFHQADSFFFQAQCTFWWSWWLRTMRKCEKQIKLWQQIQHRNVLACSMIDHIHSLCLDPQTLLWRRHVFRACLGIPYLEGDKDFAQYFSVSALIHLECVLKLNIWYWVKYMIYKSERLICRHSNIAGYAYAVSFQLKALRMPISF